MKRLKRLIERNKHKPYMAVIAFICLILLIRLAALPLSEQINRMQEKAAASLAAKLCIGIIESGSALIRHKADSMESDGKGSFIAGILKDKLPVHEYSTIKVYKRIDRMNVQGLGEVMYISDKSQEKAKSYSYYKIDSGKLTREYILTNGAAFDQQSLERMLTARDEAELRSLEVGFLYGDLYMEEYEGNGDTDAVETALLRTSIGNPFTLEQLKDINFLIRNFYIVDEATKVTENLFDSEVLLGRDMTIKQGNDAPQILIYHTHSQEAYADSREGVMEDTVVGIGSYLADILKENFGYNVIHDKSSYDMVNGKLDRNKAYNYAREGITTILDENPGIEVMIDLHRDAGGKRSALIDGKEVAQIMLLNGLSRDVNGPITYLDNPNLQDNLAFSFQLQLKSLELHPGLFYRNYLKDYRYNLHIRPKSILMELGTINNTVESARNAMDYFAEILDGVLQGGIGPN